MDHDTDTPEALEQIETAKPTTADTSLPAQLADLQASLVNAAKYTVRVFRTNAAGSWAMLATLPHLPDPDEVGRMYGGGEYLLSVQWRTQGVSTGRMNKRELQFTLADTYTAARQAELARSAVATPAAAGAGGNLQEILGTAERLAALRGNGGGDGAVVHLVEKLMDRMDRDRERTDEKFDRILDKITDLVANRPDPLTEWRRSMDMAKEMGLPVVAGGAQEEQVSPWVQVANMVADNAGKFLELMTEAKRSNVARMRLMANPMARRVAAQAPALKDPKKKAEMIAALDGKLGKEKTEAILKALEVER